MKYILQHDTFLTFRNSGIAAVLFVFAFSTNLFAQSISYISPLPGSQSVSQQTSIIVRARTPLDPAITADPLFFSVRGSLSGSHAGKTILSDDQRTLVFTPSTPFRTGEQVIVRTKPARAARDGSVVEPLKFSFGINALSTFEQQELLEEARAASDIPLPHDRTTHDANGLKREGEDQLPGHFPSPVVTVSDNPAPGSLFLASFRIRPVFGMPVFTPTDEQYLMILDNTADVEFLRPVGGMSLDFKMQPNNHLTYYDGIRKCFLELDSTYAVVDSFRTENGFTTDVHEFLLLPNGHALLLAQDVRLIDMSKIVTGGSWTARVIGCAIQELDRNKNVVFQWRSLDYIPVTDATHENFLANQIDYIHPNALDIDRDGNILLSSRHLDEITKIDRETGDIIWRLGGKGNQFTFTNDTLRFSHQHSVHRTPSGTLLLFDNGNFHTPPYSRAVEYAIDESTKTATLVWQFRHSPDVFTSAMGSVQRLENGNTLIGWGGAPFPAVTEVRPDGSIALEMEFPDNIISYRAFRFPVSKSSSTTTAIKTEGNSPSSSFGLQQNFPNPFNPDTFIRFAIPEQASVSLRVYDLLGREVALLVEAVLPPGSHASRFDASNLAAGVYVCKLRAGDRIFTKKMLLLK